MKNIYDVFQTMPMTNITKARHFEYFFGNEIPNKSPKSSRTPLTVISPDTNEEINIETFSKNESDIKTKKERKVLQILNPITKLSIDLENTKITLTDLNSDKESKILSRINLPKNHPIFDDCFEFLPTTRVTISVNNEDLVVIPKENKPKIKKPLLANFPESFKTIKTAKVNKSTLEIINPHTKEPIQINHLCEKKYNSNLTIQDPITKEKFDFKRINSIKQLSKPSAQSPSESDMFVKIDDVKERKILPVINPLTKEKINIEEYIVNSQRLQFERECRINLNGIEYPHCVKHSQINEKNIISLLKDVEDCLCGATLIISKDQPKSFQTFLNDKEIPKSNLTIFLRDGTVNSNFDKNEDDNSQLSELNNFQFCDNTLLVVYPAVSEPVFIHSQCFANNKNI